MVDQLAIGQFLSEKPRFHGHLQFHTTLTSRTNGQILELSTKQGSFGNGVGLDRTVHFQLCSNHIILYYIILYYIILYYIILHYITLYYITLHYIILYYIILYYIILYYIILYYIILYYIILYYIILYYIILYYTFFYFGIYQSYNIQLPMQFSSKSTTRTLWHYVSTCIRSQLFN